jgi:uncharacterized protein (TIGR00730 family)
VQRLPRYRTGDPDLDDRIVELLDSLGPVADPDLIFEMIVSAATMAREPANRGDLKIANAALKEMRYAFNVFSPYRMARKAAIFGSARTKSDDPLYEQTVAVAAALAERDWMVITGAGPGIMEAGVAGAGADNSFGVGIKLPFEATTSQFLVDDPKLIVFRYFFTRKVTFIKEADGFILLPGGFGTLDECFELLTLVQTGKAQPGPIVLLDVPGGTYWQSMLEFVQRELGERHYISPEDLTFLRITDDCEEAVDELCGFFSNYHSQRYVDGDLVIRLNRAPDDALLARVNREFGDIVVKGSIMPAPASKHELAEDDAVALPRIRFRFDRKSYARLRDLIDVLNGRR